MKKDVVIEVRNLSKKYIIKSNKDSNPTLRDAVMGVGKNLFKKGKKEEFWALKNVNFEVKRGEVIGVIGKNGSGKSTLLKILSKIVGPTEGKIKLKGRVASLLEVGTGFSPELSGRENIYLNGSILGMKKKEIEKKFDEIVKFSGVARFIDVPVKRYSSGMHVRLAFAVAAHLDSDILLVDEVLAVGDVEFQKKCLGKMSSLAKSGRTVIFVSHDMSSIRQLCTRVVFLKKAKVFAIGDPNEITALYENEFIDKSQLNLPTQIRKPSPGGYHFSKVELRKNGKPSVEYEAGDVMEIHLWTNKKASANSYTVEYQLCNGEGAIISFGAANPVREVYFKSKDKYFVCELDPLPLTSGKYWFNFSVRIWGMERWDTWKHAIEFRITKCDIYKTGFNLSSSTAGNFIMNQQWKSRK